MQTNLNFLQTRVHVLKVYLIFPIPIPEIMTIQ